jgi:hypothetical protein
VPASKLAAAQLHSQAAAPAAVLLNNHQAYLKHRNQAGAGLTINHRLYPDAVLHSSLGPCSICRPCSYGIVPTSS